MITYDEVQKKLTIRGDDQLSEVSQNIVQETEIIDMSGNNYSCLPTELKWFKKLRILFASHNRFDEVPMILGQCSGLEMIGLKSCGIRRIPEGSLPINLRGLILTDNFLCELPASIGTLRSLQKLMLTGNKLVTLPKELSNCQKLELIRLSSNSLEAIPEVIRVLPNLTWCADSDNLYSRVVRPSIHQYDYHGMSLGRKLGENSKNVVYQAKLSTGDTVAVKLFGGGVTTDGLPENDIAASLLAGEHPNIAGAMGMLAGAPSKQVGLVMRLIPGSHVSLANPPDMRSLTRDSYVETVEFTAEYISNIARSTASGLAHLHARGVMHGDVYAHNILVNETGDAKLVDFGAASIYDSHDPQEQWRQTCDVRGFGVLLEELSHRSSELDCAAQLSVLAADCKSSNPNVLLTFSDIVARLTK